MAFLGNPRVFMGFVGFVKLQAGAIAPSSTGQGSISHEDYTIRATSADINLTQEVSKPDVVDSRFDKSVYQMGPKLVDGSVSFPVLYEAAPDGLTLFEVLYRYAVTRNGEGNLSSFNLDVKYDNSTYANFTYTGCIVNTWKFSVAQSDVVTCDFDIIGLDRLPGNLTTPPRKQAPTCGLNETDSTANGALGTTRIVTWNDARVEMAGPRFTGGSIGGNHIRTFECNINNDAERFYSLNTVLAPQSINARKRDITGSMALMGRHPDIAKVAVDNQLNCTETSYIAFGYETPNQGEGCSSTTFNVTLPNVVFEIETMSLTNDIFESTINWHSLPSAGTGVCDPLLTNVGGYQFLYPADA